MSVEQNEVKKAKLKPKTTTTTKKKHLEAEQKKKSNVRKERGGLKAHIFRF